SISNIDNSITRNVRKDNTIIYQSNRYSVPLGTYKKDKTVFIEINEQNELIIREKSDGAMIAKHTLSIEKGKLIQDSQHTRDRSKGITAYIETVSTYFDDKEMASDFLQEIHLRYPRYIRDQLSLILKVSQTLAREIRNQALEECVARKIYSATEFRDVVEFIQRQAVSNQRPQQVEGIQTLHGMDDTLLQIKPKTRELDTYIELLKGAPV
ncbi:IS21 family transposase, partial [Oceanobacillus oncorhynchi]|nr:IS21 family transposase [Oceanobacillus oncorhynchi]